MVAQASPPIPQLWSTGFASLQAGLSVNDNGEAQRGSPEIGQPVVLHRLRGGCSDREARRRNHARAIPEGHPVVRRSDNLFDNCLYMGGG